jgi:hypothetical protein
MQAISSAAKKTQSSGRSLVNQYFCWFNKAASQTQWKVWDADVKIPAVSALPLNC